MTQQTTERKKGIALKIGIALLILGTLLWLSVLAFPFLPLAVEVKVGGAATTAIIAEVLSWAGTFLVGKELVTKYKHRLNPKNWKRSSPEA